MSDEIHRGPDEMDGALVAPLPREWLPEPVLPGGHVAWDASAARIVGALELEWAKHTARGQPDASHWVSDLGRWLRPAAALAAAAITLLFVLDDPRTHPSSTHAADEMALGLVASHGDPAALWATLGVPADPVLALLTLEDHSTFVTGGSAAGPSPGENR
jgi:hypothetical protein